MWERVIGAVLPTMARLLPPGSRVLEVGYGDGMLTCHLVHRLGWILTGLETRREAVEEARALVQRIGLGDRVELRLVQPHETRQHSGQYDGVFIKTVLYSSRDVAEYAQWLDWIAAVLKPGGVLVNLETGRSNRFTRSYRRVRRRAYADLCLYTAEIEELYAPRLEVVERRYFGGWSQFLAPLPFAYGLAWRLEELLRRRTPDNCFAVAIVAKKPTESAEACRSVDHGCPQASE